MGEPIHILSTRRLDADSEDILLRLGYRLDTVPFIATLSVDDEATLVRIRQAMASTLTVVFTSANAVQAVSECTQGEVPDWNTYALEHTTLDRIRHFLPGVFVKGTAPDATSLAELIARDAPHGPIVFFCGDQRRDELPDRLAKAGLPLEEVIVYRTVERPVALDPVYDAALFFSPSAVKSFFSVNRPRPDCIFFAIGSTTAVEIAKFGALEVIVSAAPTADELVRTVVRHYSSVS